jgi:DnaK suppressor protein
MPQVGKPLSVATPSDDLDLGAIRSDLEEIRDRTRERLAVLAARPERGSAQGFGKRIGDGTTEAVRRLTDIGVGDSLERVLARTERAVAKLNDGSYGICDVCGDPIPPGRMRALPDGVLCLKCAASERVAPAARRR